MKMIKTILILVVSLAVGGFGKNHLDIPNGFYKIQSKLDNSVLTATWEGRPRAVITSDWDSSAVQEWRIRKLAGKGPNWIQAIIRNELVKDNEVSKHFNTEMGSSKLTKEAREWTIEQVPLDPNTYNIKLEDGFCLANYGKGNRVGVQRCENAPSQQWALEFLYE